MVNSIEVGIVRCNASFTTAPNVRFHEGRAAAGATEPGTSQQSRVVAECSKEPSGSRSRAC